MLLNIGRNVKKIQTGTIENSLCPNCNFKNGLKFSIYGGFVNVIIIPTAPIKRTIIVECDNCKKIYKLIELPYEIKNIFQKQYKKSPVKTPVWQFSGSFLLAALMSVAIYTGIRAEKAEKTYIQNPLTGDIYRINNDGHFSTLKVKSVIRDSVNIYLNDMETSSGTGINEIDIDENYKRTQFFSKENLKELFDKRIIYQIDRD
jgi:hypothetical protein